MVLSSTVLRSTLAHIVDHRTLRMDSTERSDRRCVLHRHSLSALLTNHDEQFLYLNRAINARYMAYSQHDDSTLLSTYYLRSSHDLLADAEKYADPSWNAEFYDEIAPYVSSFFPYDMPPESNIILPGTRLCTHPGSRLLLGQHSSAS